MVRMVVLLLALLLVVPASGQVPDAAAPVSRGAPGMTARSLSLHPYCRWTDGGCGAGPARGDMHKGGTFISLVHDVSRSLR